MPQYPVLQPNGNIAIWSTVVDHFIALDCTPAEAVSVLSERYRNDSRLAGFVDAVQRGQRPFDHWNDWIDCLAWVLVTVGMEDETVRVAWELTTTPMVRRCAEQGAATMRAEQRADEAAYAADDLRRQLAECQAQRDELRSAFRLASDNPDIPECYRDAMRDTLERTRT